MFNKLEAIERVREKLRTGGRSLGSWMQLPNSSVAEILGDAGYDWVAVDMEHGAFSKALLPDIFRALELGGTLPFARLAQGSVKDCKDALDAGAAGVIIPMIRDAEHVKEVLGHCCWPPAGTRGVGFSRANLFGKRFEEYRKEAQKPFFAAMIENVSAAEQAGEIAQIAGLDALLIGPYDLSASMGMTGEFDRPEFKAVIEKVLTSCAAHNMACGIHVVEPSPTMLNEAIEKGYRFNAYSIDSLFLMRASESPDLA
ncbi:MAG: 2,4-dihydroxyhept-2-ene-1,7-dioic acid aldolase [Alteromonadaceae bacterium]|nr:MAG: 2,4-dihydroxyhept-2-ene-1,7-dioic acid aldolase [Alteromonadaceae bacterium]